MEANAFPFPRKPGTCICCGVDIATAGHTDEYRRIHFRLSDGTAAAVSVCPGCESREWTAERIQQLDAHCHAMWERVRHPLQEKAWDHRTVTFLERATEYPVQTWNELDGLQVRL